MDFLYNLFPYKSAFHSDSNTLTFYWVLATIIYFLWSVYFFLYRKVRPIYKSLQDINNEFDIEKISNNNYLKSSFQNYQNSMILIEGKIKKTNEEANYYFSESSILGNSINIKLFQATPSTLVGFGILGTFVGLTVGVTYFDTSSTAEIQKSIQKLLSGMGTAFISSIYGMALSIGYIIWEKIIFHKFNFELNLFCLKLDSIFLITKEDEQYLEREKQKEFYNKFFGFYDDDNKPITPGNFFRRQIIESEQQTKALKSFSTDLADGIKISTETIYALADKIIPVFQNSFNTEITPIFDKLNFAVEELIKSKEQSSESVINQIVENLKNTLEQVTSNFSNSLSDSTINKLQQLDKSFDEINGTLTNLPAQLDSIMSQINSNVVRQQDLINSNSKSLQDTTNITITNIKSELDSTTNSFSQIIQEFFSKQKDNFKLYEEVKNNLGNIISKTEGLLTNVKNSLGFYDNNIKNLTNSAIQINQSSSLLKNSSDILKNSLSLFTQQNSIIQNDNKKFIETINNNLKNVDKLANSYTNKFNEIDNNLAGIFEQIQDGLFKYQNAVRNTLENYLGDFAKQFTDAANSLASGVTEIDEFVEAITELIDKANNIP